MFSQASVILSIGGGGCVAGLFIAGGSAWQGGVRGWGMHGRGAHVWRGGGGVHGRRDGHCNGRHASYWNAFLLRVILLPLL